MAIDRDKNRRTRGKPEPRADEEQEVGFEKLVRRAPQFRGLAKVAEGGDKELTSAQEKFLDEFSVGLAKGVEESDTAPDEH